MQINPPQHLFSTQIPTFPSFPMGSSIVQGFHEPELMTMEENIPLMRSNAKAGSLIEVSQGWMVGWWRPTADTVDMVGYGFCDLCHLNHHISCRSWWNLEGVCRIQPTWQFLPS